MVIRFFMFLKFLIKSATYNSNERMSTWQSKVNNVLTNKQNVFDSFLYNKRYNSQTTFDDEVLTFNDVKDIDSYGVRSVKHDKDTSVFNENQSSSLESSVFDFLDNLDYVDMPEELEKLNNCELMVLNPRDIEEVLKHEENLCKINVNVTKDCNSFILENIQKNSIEDQMQCTKNKDTFESDLNKRHDIIKEKYMRKMKFNIIKFIKKTIPDYYVSFYIKRLTALERALVGINFYIFKNYNTLSFRDCEIIKILTKLHSNFGNNKVYNQETYQIFNNEFNSIISEECVSFFCIPIVNLPKNYERYYFEMMKLYKYIYDMPELLKIVDIYSDNLFYGFTFILHLINLFAEKIGSLKNNRVFILFLMNKAFSYSNKYKSDFFFFPKCHIICAKEHYNIDFLFWELHISRRAHMKKRIKLKDTIICNKNDKVHFKKILAIYLYQHFEFLIFYNFNEV